LVPVDDKVTGLADAHADDAALGLVEHLHRLAEGLPQVLGQPVQRLGFDGQHPPADVDGVEFEHGDVVHDQFPGEAVEEAEGARLSTGGGPEARARAALAAAVCCTGRWPKGAGERAPSPWGQTSARAIMVAEARPINVNSRRSDIGDAISAELREGQIPNRGIHISHC
jgi:hypothetical protein